MVIGPYPLGFARRVISYICIYIYIRRDPTSRVLDTCQRRETRFKYISPDYATGVATRCMSILEGSRGTGFKHIGKTIPPGQGCPYYRDPGALIGHVSSNGGFRVGA